ncbi:SGNH/GDSL hydrolase family protein [Paenibacillus sonchi]|uniref:SGNH/GDSL hydrolase family protein n=1 Tax=Paenibacillus sonchi TaxID=373687 RepID=A0A974SBY8_9BACL|nr:SGNH/GDSL hydrolase family protein [Paenibacillus sonchi]MCE3199689.1 SGNH/GDSL hydrolase family protein [Paenibacillus sonchi]QQZ58645.1 SGNH/GDSL hydrolase family protein [Paenibacillus sonchi]
MDSIRYNYNHYLQDMKEELGKQWPDNRTLNIVCHGHSVPSGYFATPVVDSFNAYPHLLHKQVKAHYPYAVLNVIVTGIGGETSLSGRTRITGDVLGHRPDVVTIDYGLNDRGIGLSAAQESWKEMIELLLDREIKVILLTPTWDRSYGTGDESWLSLQQHTEQIRHLAQEYKVGLCDSFAAYQSYVDAGGILEDLLSYVNHPNARGHALVAGELAKFLL